MSIEGLAILAIVYLVLNLIAKAGKKLGGHFEAAQEQAADRGPDQSQGEEFSLKKLLREIERARVEGERKPTRGPLGRMARLSTEIISEGRSLEVEESIVNFDAAASTRAVRAEIDQDDQAQAVIQRRLDAAAHRTREGREASYQAQQKAAAAAVASEALSAAAASSRLRRAIVWREILGPPLALRGEWGGDS